MTYDISEEDDITKYVITSYNRIEWIEIIIILYVFKFKYVL